MDALPIHYVFVMYSLFFDCSTIYIYIHIHMHVTICYMYLVLYYSVTQCVFIVCSLHFYIFSLCIHVAYILYSYLWILPITFPYFRTIDCRFRHRGPAGQQALHFSCFGISSDHFPKDVLLYDVIAVFFCIVAWHRSNLVDRRDWFLQNPLAGLLYCNDLQ